MCFRPTSVSKKLKCSKCGKEITMMAGTVQKKCPFCGAELSTSEKKDSK